MANGASSMATSSQLLHQLLEEKAAKTPVKCALEFLPSVRMTYHELNENSNRLARYIKAHRAPGKDVVALCLKKTHRAVIAVLASLKAGMAWLPLPLDAPPSRIDQIFRACDMGLVLSSKDTANIVPNTTHWIDIDEILASSELQALDGTNLEGTHGSLDDLCCILFISDSTGTPKGIMLEHRAVMHLVRAFIKQFALDTKTRTLQFAAMTFDVFSLDLFMTFACGGCLVMAPLSDMIGDLTSFMHKAVIDYAHLTPTIIRLIDPAGVPMLKTLVSSGEALSQSIANHWRHQVRLFNAYGPTETILCTTQEVSGSQADPACLGHAIPGVDVCVIAEQGMDEVREGEVGEICVAGPQLFRGYISSLEKTQSSEFHRMGKRYYRTGDLGRWETAPSGGKTFTMVGRKDGMVKVHGVRVDVGDVESSISPLSTIKQCVVVLPRSGSCAGHLCSIIVPQSSLIDHHPNGAEPHRSCGVSSEIQLPRQLPIQVAHATPSVLSALADAKSAATTRLPTHAIPTNWWAILEMPLTSTGQIDRTKLRCWIEDMKPQMYLEHAKAFSAESEPAIAPSNDSQKRLLLSLWSEVLGRPASSLRTNVSFIELGADSLDVIQFVAKARNAGLKFDLSQVHTARTIEGLTHVQPPGEVNSKPHSDWSYVPFSLLPRHQPLASILENVAATCRLEIGKIEDIYPCTPYQSELIVLSPHVHAVPTIEDLAHVQQSEKTNSKRGSDSSYVPFSLLPRNRPLGPFLENAAATCGLQVGKIEDIYPCTPYQSGLMVLDLKCPMSYVCAWSWTLLQDLDIGRFRAAWNDLVASEPVLRNRLIWDTASQDFWQVTVRHERCKWSKKDFESPMSLGHTLYRGFVSRDVATQRWKFQLKVHHCMIDGWSLKLVLNRLKSMYFREECQRPIAAPFAHFIRLRVEESKHQEMASQEFWTRYLMNFSPSDFPPSPSDPSHEVRANCRLSLSVPMNLREVASRYEVTPAAMLCAAATLVLGAYGDTSDVSFGLILTGRDAPLDGVYEMVGPAFAIAPLRMRVERRMSTVGLLQSVARQIVEIIPHQHYGLQHIKRCGGAGAAAACELRCLVVVQPEDENLAGKGLWEEVHGQVGGVADTIPLSLELVLGEDRIAINSNSDPAYLSAEDGKVLIGHVGAVLGSFQSMDPRDLVAQVPVCGGNND